MTNLTASLEDYLEIIYNHSGVDRSLRAVDISKKLNISRASVAEALKKLVAKGYINYDRYDNISLTDLGQSSASEVVSKHSVLQVFFEQILGLSAEEASENACKIEHVITNNAYLKMANYIENLNNEHN